MPAAKSSKKAAAKPKSRSVVPIPSTIESIRGYPEKLIIFKVPASPFWWVRYYDGKPINLKTANLLVQYPGPKYKKVSFSNVGHAKNLARKLNQQFRTDKFSVVLLTQGQTIYPDSGKTS